MLEEFVVGIVRGSHGVLGEFKVESTSGDYSHFANMKEVTLTDGVKKLKCKVESVREGGNTLFMKVSGIDTPEKAKEYNKWNIVVPREDAHPLEKNEWYIEDLKGCSVFYEDGLAKSAPASLPQDKVVGTVTDVLEGGAGYLVEISLSESSNLLSEDLKHTSSGKVRSVLVPFNKEFIGTVDVEKRMMGLMHLWILE